MNSNQERRHHTTIPSRKGDTDYASKVNKMVVEAGQHEDASRVLPVLEAQRALIDMIQRNRAVIIVGETGSGKTTQIPQFVWDHIVSHYPAGSRGIVGCTQPRRVAAVSIARHVAHQRECGGVPLKGEVGYAVRFDDTTSPATKIKFMTDGILLREIQSDPDLKKYSCLLLDEAHERTLHGDVLFGLLKDIARRRTDLKIIVMSATLNAEHFSKYWWDAPIGVVHGRSYPVVVYHTVEPQADYVEASISTILQIHKEEAAGDVLCFLAGQEDIEDAKQLLEQRLKLFQSDVPDFLVLTLYSAMPYEKQLEVFDPSPAGQRKIILATNIAETSITVEGIKYVVDAGVVKAKFFNEKTGMESLSEVDISRAQATQRAGRAGRMAAGKCFRVYTSEAFESLAENTVPEIRRCSLDGVVLQMKSLHINNILDFEFMDKPRSESLVKAEELLVLLGALDRESCITPLGRRMTDFPIEPAAAKVLLAGKALGAARDAVAVIALITTENLFLTSRDHKAGADKCRTAFTKVCGDHSTLLSIFQAYCKTAKNQRKWWCDTNSINYRQMQKVEDTIQQLTAILMEKDDTALFESCHLSLNGYGASNGFRKRGREGLLHDSCDELDFDSHPPHGKAPRADFEPLRRALTHGYFLQVAFFNAKLGFYQTVIGQQVVHVHPSSALFTMRRKPPLVAYSSVVETTKKYMKDISSITEAWLCEAAPMLYSGK